MKGVLLFYPSLTNGKESPTLYTALPLSLIALAAQLYREELPVEILDERLHIYTESEIRDKLDGAWMVGISAITSYQIVNGLLFRRYGTSAGAGYSPRLGRLASHSHAL